MHTDTTTASTTDLAPAAPLMLGTVPASRRRNLAAALAGGPVRWETAGPGPSEAELQAARAAVADPRTTQGRVLDAVVDRLMRAMAEQGQR